MDFDKAVAEIARELPQVEAIYVFGSAAREQMNAESDVDLAVLCPTRLGPQQRWELQAKLATLLGRDVDLVDMHAATTVMQVQVLAEGRVLLDAKPSTRALFEARTLSDYADLNERRAGILADIKERGTVYG